jgi:hypothetical protein
MRRSGSSVRMRVPAAGIDEFFSVRDASDHLVDQANAAGVTIYGLAVEGQGRGGSRTAGLDAITLETGGRTFAKPNDLSGGAAAILEENSGYYLVGFDPGSVTAAPRKLRVRVRRPDLRVSGRRSALDPASLTGESKSEKEEDLAAMLDSPFAAGELSVSVTPYLRWIDSRRSRLQSVIEVAAAGLHFARDAENGRIAELEVRLRVVDPKGEGLPETSTRLRARLQASEPAPVRFVLTQELPAAPGLYDVDVALRDGRSGPGGSATRAVEQASRQNKRLALASLVLRDASAPESFPADRFPPNAVVALECQVAGARVERESGADRIQIDSRVLDGDRVVVATRPQVLSRPMPDPFLVTGRVPLTGLPPGECRVELKVLDLVSGKAEARASAVFRVQDR